MFAFSRQSIRSTLSRKPVTATTLPMSAARDPSSLRSRTSAWICSRTAVFRAPWKRWKNEVVAKLTATPPSPAKDTRKASLPTRIVASLNGVAAPAGGVNASRVMDCAFWNVASIRVGMGLSPSSLLEVGACLPRLRATGDPGYSFSATPFANATNRPRISGHSASETWT